MGFWHGGGRILAFSIDLLRRLYNTLALPREGMIVVEMLEQCTVVCDSTVRADTSSLISFAGWTQLNVVTEL